MFLTLKVAKFCLRFPYSRWKLNGSSASFFSAAPLRGHHSICSISSCSFHHFLLLQPSAWPTVGFLLTDSSKFSIVCPVSPPSVFCTCPSHLTLRCPSYFFQSGQSLGLLPFCKCHCLKIIHHSRSPYHLVNIPFNIPSDTHPTLPTLSSSSLLCRFCFKMFISCIYIYPSSVPLLLGTSLFCLYPSYSL